MNNSDWLKRLDSFVDKTIACTDGVYFSVDGSWFYIEWPDESSQED